MMKVKCPTKFNTSLQVNSRFVNSAGYVKFVNLPRKIPNNESNNDFSAEQKATLLTMESNSKLFNPNFFKPKFFSI